VTVSEGYRQLLASRSNEERIHPHDAGSGARGAGAADLHHFIHALVSLKSSPERTRKLGNLQRLELKGIPLCPHDSYELVHSVRSFTSLLELSTWNCGVTDDFAVELASSIAKCCQQLRKWDVSMNGLGADSKLGIEEAFASRAFLLLGYS
jgi:hypothetical protein